MNVFEMPVILPLVVIVVIAKMSKRHSNVLAGMATLDSSVT